MHDERNRFQRNTPRQWQLLQRYIGVQKSSTYLKFREEKIDTFEDRLPPYYFPSVKDLIRKHVSLYRTLSLLKHFNFKIGTKIGLDWTKNMEDILKNRLFYKTN
jgi:hypothetical protein